MKKLKGKQVVKEYGTLRKIYANNYCIESFLLEDDTVLMQVYKNGRRVPELWTIVSKERFEEEYLNAEGSSFDLVLDAVQFIKARNDYYEHGYFNEDLQHHY